MNRVFKPRPATAQQSDGYAHVSGEPENLLSIEAARFLGFDRTHGGKARAARESMRLFREWAKRERVPALHRGRTLLYERRVLLAFLHGNRWTLDRHGNTVRISPTGQKTKTVTGNAVTTSELA